MNEYYSKISVLYAVTVLKPHNVDVVGFWIFKTFPIVLVKYRVELANEFPNIEIKSGSAVAWTLTNGLVVTIRKITINILDIVKNWIIHTNF